MYIATLNSDIQTVRKALKKAVFKLGYSNLSFDDDSCYFETPNTMKQGLAVSILIDDIGGDNTELSFSFDYKKTMGFKPIVAVPDKQKKAVQQNVMAVVSSILSESLEDKRATKEKKADGSTPETKEKPEAVVEGILKQQEKAKSNSSAIIIISIFVGFFMIFFLPKMISESKTYDSINDISEKIIMKNKEDVVRILGTPDSDRGETLVYFKMYHNKASNTYCDVYVYLTYRSGVYDVRYGGCRK